MSHNILLVFEVTILVLAIFLGVEVISKVPALLHTPLDPELDTLGKSFAKFTAPRSMRDVEPSVCLWLKRLDGVAIDLAAEGEDS